MKRWLAVAALCAATACATGPLAPDGQVRLTVMTNVSSVITVREPNNRGDLGEVAVTTLQVSVLANVPLDITVAPMDGRAALERHATLHTDTTIRMDF